MLGVVVVGEDGEVVCHVWMIVPVGVFVVAVVVVIVVVVVERRLVEPPDDDDEEAIDGV